MTDLGALTTAMTQYRQSLDTVTVQDLFASSQAKRLPVLPSTAPTQASTPTPTAPTSDPVFALLRSRDAVQSALDDLKKEGQLSAVSSDTINELIELDRDLQALEGHLGKLKALKAWRKTLEPSAEAWWWWPLHPSDRWDWLWSAATLVALTGNLALVTDLAPRFLAGGTSFGGALGAIVPAVLTLLGGSSLTETGKRLLEQGLEKLGLPEHWWQEVKCGFSWGVLGLLLLFKNGLPTLADWYTQQGQAQWKNHNLASAQGYLERALALVEDQPEAQFYLGLIYEDFQQDDKAFVEYQKSWQGDYLPASNNLAALYIEQEEYAAAIAILQAGLSSPELSQDPELEYALRKNLGQIRLIQERYQGAEAQLQQAIVLQKSHQIERGSAYCLLAELQEALGQPALQSWQSCLTQTQTDEPRSDQWRYTAGVRLNGSPSTPPVQPTSP